MSVTKLLFLSGSIRKESFNTKLAKNAHTYAQSKHTAENPIDAQFIDLADYSMPIYNGDDEASNGLPESTLALKQLFIECDGFFIASPEYNSAYSALLKNTIDWLSRPSQKGEPMLHAFSGKVAAISATSPGALGGLRGLAALRLLLANINCHVIPAQAAIGQYTTAFDESGVLIEPKAQKMLNGVVDSFITTAQKLG